MAPTSWMRTRGTDPPVVLSMGGVLHNNEYHRKKLITGDAPADAFLAYRDDRAHMQQRLDRARAANRERADAEQTRGKVSPDIIEHYLSVAKWASAEENGAGIGGRQTELRARLRVLAQRSEQSWSVKEMRAALSAGGIWVGAHVDKPELRLRTKALAESARLGWAAMEEIHQASKKAEIAKANARRSAGRKFLSLSRARSRRAAASAARRAGEESTPLVSDDDDDISLSDDASNASSSYRASFRARGGAHAARVPKGHAAPPANQTLTPRSARRLSREGANDNSAAAAGEEQSGVLELLRSVLLPAFLPDDTLWAQAVGRCLHGPAGMPRTPREEAPAAAGADEEAAEAADWFAQLSARTQLLWQLEAEREHENRETAPAGPRPPEVEVPPGIRYTGRLIPFRRPPTPPVAFRKPVSRRKATPRAGPSVSWM